MSKTYSGLFNTPVSLPHTHIRYSQESVNGSADIISSMKKYGWIGSPIDVVKMEDSRLTTIDNTRVVAAAKVGIDVRATVHSYDEPLTGIEISRFTTNKGVPKTWGEAIALRIRKQSSTWRKNHPYGAYHMDANKIK